MPRLTPCRRLAFTLVELLVVIGVIAILVGVLLPMMTQARESSRSAVCLSNLRQIAVALQMYADHNQDRYPAPAWIGDPEPDDWLYWQQNRDPSQSALSPYVAGSLVDILRCPSDDVTAHHPTDGGPGDTIDKYLYSYTVNESICNHFNRLSKRPVIVRSQILYPASKILVVDESSTTVDDGCWWSSGGVNQKGAANILSNRHDKLREDSSNFSAGRGNAAFVDCHAEWVARSDSMTPAFFDPLASQ